MMALSRAIILEGSVVVASNTIIDVCPFQTRVSRLCCKAIKANEFYFYFFCGGGGGVCMFRLRYVLNSFGKVIRLCG